MYHNSHKLSLVSIITPAYNAERFIRETIESVQAQTHEEWEMIIIDDCSIDHTYDLVKEAAKYDPRIHLIKHINNSGPAKARNTGLEKARGRFVAFLDSDDKWLPIKIERQLSFMSKKNAAFSFTQYRRISDKDEKIGRVISIPLSLNYHGLLKNTAIVTSTVMINKERTGSFQMLDTYYDDFVLWLELLKRGFISYGLREDLVRYRIVKKSVSRNKIRSATWVWRTYRKVEKLKSVYAAWCFVNYAWNAFFKYRKF